MRPLSMILLATVLTLGCNGGDTQTDSDAEFDTDSDTDTDSNTDTETDTVTDTGTGTGTSTSAFPPAEVTEGLIFRLPFNGHSNDVVGGLNSIGGTATLVPDRHGNPDSAYAFTALDYFTYADTSSLDTMTGLSITAFIKQTSFGSGNVRAVAKWSYDAPSEQYGWFLSGNDNMLALGRVTPNGEFDFANYTTDTWHHVAIVWFMEFGSHRTYVDGVQRLNTDRGAYINSDGSDVDLVVGGLIGVMDEVRIYNRALTEAEITTIAAEE